VRAHKGKEIVLLNADHTVLTLVTVMRAIGLYMSERATILDFDDDSPIIHPRLGIKRPVIMALNKYIYVPHRVVKLNRRNIMMRDDYRCQYCGKSLRNRKATLDHVVPRSHPTFPGVGSWTNVVACCEKCNNRKGNKLLNDIDMELLRKPFKPKVEDFVKQNKKAARIIEKYLDHSTNCS